ncbi:hypothetical protein HAX54_013610 [Datura stramonium]|uniref:Uncharacterized protein n=1 Tax=Datura stramonium TaxID=4076 RepID=A0ABS8TN90_DATST|nr:hypothetical protein [Datura stramonium]
MLPTEKQENLEKLRAEVRKGKRPISELYELKPIVPTFSNFERGGTSENEMKEEDEFDYDQDLAILKFMNDYYFDHGGVIPCPYSEKFIDDIKALIPNLKIHGQALMVGYFPAQFECQKLCRMVTKAALETGEERSYGSSLGSKYLSYMGSKKWENFQTKCCDLKVCCKEDYEGNQDKTGRER